MPACLRTVYIMLQDISRTLVSLREILPNPWIFPEPDLVADKSITENVLWTQNNSTM